MKKFLPISLGVLFALAAAGCAGGSSPGATPAIRPGTASAAGPDAELMPPFELEGWQLDEPGSPLKSYNRANLYLYLGDAADLYLSYGFHELSHGVYRFTLLGEPAVTVDLYRMNTPTDAYGIFTATADRSAKIVEIGGCAHEGAKKLEFWKGTRFVRIELTGKTDKPAETLEYFAKGLAERIEGTTEVPALTLFPAENRVPGGDRRVVKALVGCEDLGAGYTVEYEIDGRKATVFLSAGSKDPEVGYLKLREMLSKPGSTPAILPGPWLHGSKGRHPTLGDGLFVLTKSEVPLKKPLVAGVFGLGDSEEAQKILADFVDKLAAK